mgnify:CR=1 FL=1
MSHAFDIVLSEAEKLGVVVVLSRVCAERGSHTSCAMYRYGMTGESRPRGAGAHMPFILQNENDVFRILYTSHSTEIKFRV